MTAPRHAGKGGRGRPLRFLAGLTGGWVVLRIVMLWPSAPVPQGHFFPALPSFLPVALAEPRSATVPRLVDQPRRGGTAWPISGRTPPSLPAPRPKPDRMRVALALLGLVRFGDPQPVEDTPAPVLPGVPHATPPVVAMPEPRRLTGSFWLVARGGGRGGGGGGGGGGIAPGVVGGQLGGSQAGLRLAYLLDPKHRVALAVRATTPLGRGMRELAAGVEWQPTRLPIRLVAEQRFVIERGGTGGPALGIVAGLGPKPLGAGVTLEAYGQAGAIRRDSTELYADGAVHVAHDLLDLGGARLDFGAGLWAGAQRGAARLDAGPTLALTLPVAKRALRLSIDWRERAAGRARPGSGLALTLGADF